MLHDGQQLFFLSNAEQWIRIYNALKRGENSKNLYACLSVVYEFVIWKAQRRRGSVLKKRSALKGQ